MIDTVPLRVKILQDKNGRARYPDFNKTLKAIGVNQDWSHYVDRFTGWMYDKKSGHDDDTPSSPRGQRWGVIVVPVDFATAAEEMFPEQCDILNEQELSNFYENHVTVDEPDVTESLEDLQLLKVKTDLGIISVQEREEALNPDHPRPGRKRNKRKTWAGYKEDRGIEIDDQAVRRLKRRRSERG